MSDLFELYSSPDGYPPNCCIGLELTRQVSDYDVGARTQAYRMRVTVTNQNNVDPNVFVYQVLQPSEEEVSAYSQFSRVASPLDLEELPVGPLLEPGLSDQFRLAELDLLFSSRDTLEEAWTAILNDRNELVRTLQNLCALQADIISADGCFAEDESSEPSSESSSEPSSESAEADDCADAAPACLRISYSDHPLFPADTQAAELVGVGPPEPPECTRTWQFVGTDLISWANLLIDERTGAVRFVVSSADEETGGTAQLSQEYGVVIQYVFGGIPRALWIEASDECD